MPLFHSTFSMFSISLGRKQATISGEILITLSKKSKTNFEENAKWSWQRVFSDNRISFLNRNQVLDPLSFKMYE